MLLLLLFGKFMKESIMEEDLMFTMVERHEAIEIDHQDVHQVAVADFDVLLLVGEVVLV